MSTSKHSAEARELLSRAPAFSRLPNSSLRKLVRLCVPRQYQANDVIIDEGATGLGLFVIAAGQVEVFKGTATGRVTLATLGRGDILGELALIDEQPRSASAVALTDTTCLLITRSSFHELVQREPAIAWCFVPVLSERLRFMQSQVMAAAREQPHQAEAALEVAPPPAPRPADEPSSRQEEPRRRDSAFLDLFHAQHALFRAGISAASTSVGAARSFVDTLVDETGLGSDERAAEVVRRVPRGMLRAMTSALKEVEKTPERMLSTFQHHFDRD